MIGYFTESSERPYEIILKIDDSWEDQGYNYYKIYTTSSTGFISYELWRINKNKTTLELNWLRDSYPAEINPKSSNYLIYYRQ